VIYWRQLTGIGASISEPGAPEFATSPHMLHITPRCHDQSGSSSFGTTIFSFFSASNKSLRYLDSHATPGKGA
jgi:hypothetical protein